MSGKSKINTIEYLRVAITAACNFFCLYCREKTEKYLLENYINISVLRNVVKVFAQYGLKTVRITGGEPLLVPHLEKYIEAISPLVEEVALTTNGYFLEEKAEKLKKAGLKRLNVSLDTLKEEKFKKLTLTGDLKKVLRGLEKAKKVGFKNIKINIVAIKNFTEEEVEDFIYFAKENDFHIRFIELMPVGNLSFFKEDRFLPLDYIKRIIIEKFGELKPLGRIGSKASKDFIISSLNVKVGFIKSITEPFCENCKKLRLTSDGLLHFCLRRDYSFNIKPYWDKEEKLHSIMDEIIKLKNISNELILKENFQWLTKKKGMIVIGG
jgi:cyclic pyranopterin phosphate synthase